VCVCSPQIINDRSPLLANLLYAMHRYMRNAIGGNKFWVKRRACVRPYLVLPLSRCCRCPSRSRSRRGLLLLLTLSSSACVWCSAVSRRWRSRQSPDAKLSPVGKVLTKEEKEDTGDDDGGRPGVRSLSAAPPVVLCSMAVCLCGPSIARRSVVTITLDLKPCVCACVPVRAGRGW
jgi:hypothetical protein